VIDILHLHGFKCAGTTFASILQDNYGDAVGYVESQGKGDRLPWQLIPDTLDLNDYRAVSSHLVTLPPAGEGFARMHVAFVRDPRERIRSAYRFQRRTGSLSDPGLDFAGFLQRLRTSTVANYQTRQLSPQDFGGWRQRKGWQLRPELIDFSREDLFIGVVERFDESLVLLEARLQEMGIRFDGAYPSALNVEAKHEEEELVGIPVDAVELDEILCQRAATALSAARSATPDFAARLKDFRDRCVRRAERGAAARVPGPGEWRFVDPSGFVQEASGRVSARRVPN
jgi:hypothetical protein